MKAFLVLGFFFSCFLLHGQSQPFSVGLFIYPDTSQLRSIDRDLRPFFERLSSYRYLGLKVDGNPYYRIIIQEPSDGAAEPTIDLYVLARNRAVRQTSLSAKAWLKGPERWTSVAAECSNYIRRWFEAGPPKKLHRPVLEHPQSHRFRGSSHSKADSKSPSSSDGNRAQGRSLGVELVGHRREVGRSANPFDPLSIALDADYLWRKAIARPQAQEESPWSVTLNLEGGHDSNPSQTANSQGSDAFWKASVTAGWTPASSHDLGYTLFTKNYFDQNDLNILAHLLTYGHRRKLGELDWGIRVKGLALSLDESHTLTQFGLATDLKVPLVKNLKLIFKPHVEQSSYEESLSGLDGNQYGAQLGLETKLKPSKVTLSGGFKYSVHEADDLDYEVWGALVRIKLKSEISGVALSHRIGLDWKQREDNTLTMGQQREDKSLGAHYQVSHTLSAFGGLNLGAKVQFKTIDSNIEFADTTRSVFALSVRKAW